MPTLNVKIDAICEQIFSMNVKCCIHLARKHFSHFELLFHIKRHFFTFGVDIFSHLGTFSHIETFSHLRVPQTIHYQTPIKPITIKTLHMYCENA